MKTTYSKIKIHKTSQGVCMMYQCSKWGHVTYHKKWEGRIMEMRLCKDCARGGGLID